MKFWSEDIKNGQCIPACYAVGVIGQKDFGLNRNPTLNWDDVPEGTKSFVIICHDPDVPAVKDDVNKENREIPASTPREDFFHWVLVDLPADLRKIKEGEFSNEFTVGGKTGPAALYGSRQGLNDYTQANAGNAQMQGQYFGYDGPCPPFNDSIAHRYIFTLYALSVERLNVDGDFTGQQVLDALVTLKAQGNVLAQTYFSGIYTLNPRVEI